LIASPFHNVQSYAFQNNKAERAKKKTNQHLYHIICIYMTK
jgi:hypothetical protein